MNRFALLTVVLLFAAIIVYTSAPERKPGPLQDTQTAAAELETAGSLAIEAKSRTLASNGPKSFDQPREAAEFFVRQRRAPGENDLPIEHLEVQRQAVKRREQMRATTGTVTWNALGPGNIGGRTRAIAMHPADPDIMYAAGVAGGIWKSFDAGQSWQPMDDFMLNLAVSTIVIDPGNPDILYAATGEGYFGSDVFVRGLGIFKSTDAGQTWSQLDGTVNGVPNGAFHYVNDLVVSPNDSRRLYAATRYGVWQSDDAGETWRVVLNNPNYLDGEPRTSGCRVGCTDLAVRSDRNPDVLFAAFGSFDRDGLYRSLDGGVTWELVVGGTIRQGRMTMSIAPSDNDVIYMCMAANLNGETGKLVNVFRSVDGGTEWEHRVDLESKTGPWLLSNLVLATGCAAGGTYHQGWYDNVIAVDPINPDIVWVGGIDLFRSDDGGVTFGIASYWFYYQLDPPPAIYAHPDQHRILFHPDYDGVNNQTMYVGNDGGLFKTDNARAATSFEDCPFPADEPLPDIEWENLNNGYAVTQFYHGDSARSEDVFLGGCQDNGSNRARSRNSHDDWKLVFGGDGGYSAIDPRDSDVMFVEYQGFPTIHKSVDGGETFEPSFNGITDTDGIFITPYAMDPNNPSVMWTGGQRPWRTTDGAESWHRAGGNLAFADRLSAIAIAPSDSNVVYLGYDNGYVARTTNGLSESPTWTLLSDGLRRSWISSVAVDPQDVDVAYCTYSNYGGGHIFRTGDGGQSWTRLDGVDFEGVPDIPVHWIAVRPCDSSELYVGTELGVFTSRDTGQTWEPANAGLAHTVVESLDFKTEETLVAFTHGRGAFLAELNPCGEDCDVLVSHDAHGKVGRVRSTVVTSLMAGKVRVECIGDEGAGQRTRRIRDDGSSRARINDLQPGEYMCSVTLVKDGQGNRRCRGTFEPRRVTVR